MTDSVDKPGVNKMKNVIKWFVIGSLALVASILVNQLEETTETKTVETTSIFDSMKEETTNIAESVKEDFWDSQARGTAENYLSFSAFSREGLINQLKFEGYSTEEAVNAVDSLSVDWNEQAAKKAEEYLAFSSFSKSGLIDQLKFEGFTDSQARYGVASIGG